MLAGAVATGPCFYLLFSPPRTLGNAGLFAWLLTFSILFRFVSAVYRIPYMSLGAELTDDYHERTRIIAVRAFFGLVGTLAAATLTFLLFFATAREGVDPKLEYVNYPRMGAFCGAMMTVAGLVATAGTWSVRHGSIPAQGIRSVREFFRGFRNAFSSSSYLRLWLSVTLFMNAVAINATLAVHYLTWYARLPDARAMSGIQMSFYLGAILGVFGWMRLARRREKATLYLAGMLGTAAVLACASLLVGEGRFFGTGNLRILMAGQALAGVFASCLWAIPSAMMADVVDEEELRSGASRTGVSFGILNIGEKIAVGLAVLTSGTLLNYFVRLEPGAAAQSREATEKIGMLYGLLPALMVTAAALLIIGYKLDAGKVAAIQKRLVTQRARGPGK
jgi:GPH family glycoside/pentoside/hexuronide:cation symporter